MDTFIIHIGKIKFHIEPIPNNSDIEEDGLGKFKIYEDDNVFILNEAKIDDIPPGHLMGTLTVKDLKNPKDFDFNGSGKISGAELVQIAQLIIEQFEDKNC
jgi:hypothetical protein